MGQFNQLDRRDLHSGILSHEDAAAVSRLGAWRVGKLALRAEDCFRRLGIPLSYVLAADRPFVSVH